MKPDKAMNLNRTKLHSTILCSVIACSLGGALFCRRYPGSNRIGLADTRTGLAASRDQSRLSPGEAQSDHHFDGGPNRPAFAGLQSRLNALMTGQAGDVIVSDPRTGQIIAAWNLESGLRNAYPPGSTAKIVESAAALEGGVVSARDRVYCRRVPPVLGSMFQCVHPPSRSGFTLPLALANSCNYYFTALSLQLSSATLSHWYSVFGFGEGADSNVLPRGHVAVGQDARAKALAALGESDVVATPAQVLQAYSALANGGEYRILWSAREPRQRSLPGRRIQVRPSTFETLIDGLVGCVQFGTCQAAAVPGVRVAGKTGTATVLDGSGATHAWFVGFAPAEDPEIAIVVFIERGTGAHTAAPIAGAILDAYFAGSSKSQSLETDDREAEF